MKCYIFKKLDFSSMLKENKLNKRILFGEGESFYCPFRCSLENYTSVGRMGARQPVVRHCQADVVVVAVRFDVVGPADGQDVIL